MFRSEEASEFSGNGIGDLVFLKEVINEVIFVVRSSKTMVDPLVMPFYNCDAGVGRPNYMDTITDLHSVEVSIEIYILEFVNLA